MFNEKGFDEKMHRVKEEKEYFGDRFLFKEPHYEHGKETFIAAMHTADGHYIEVFITSMPARFYKFRFNRGRSIETGSLNFKEFKLLYELIKDGRLMIA